MSTIGDSFAIVAILAGLGLTTWAMMVGASLLFADKALAARNLTESHPWRGLGIGLAVGLPLGFISIAMSGLPNPGAKLLGTMGLIALSSIAMFGMSGLCLTIASRIRAIEPSLSVYGALTRAATVIVIASFLPLLGWFFVAPLLFIFSLGVGVQSIFAKRPVAFEVM